MKRITIEFITPYPPYAKGDRATFFEREAERLTDRGFAVYAGGDTKREEAADRLRALRGAPETRHVEGPAATRHIPGPSDTRGQSTGNRPAQVEGGASGRKCGLCGKPGHTRNACPKK